MKFLKKNIFIALAAVLIIIFIVLLCVFIFISKNYISINGYINTKHPTEFVITDDKLNNTTFSIDDEEYKVVNHILSNAKIYFYSDGMLEYDIEKDVIELKNGSKSKKFFMYNNEKSNSVLVIVYDFFENADTAKKLDYPYYFVAELSLSDYYKIFPKSTLLFENNITAIIDTDIQTNTDNHSEPNAKLHIRNDNDCAIRFEKINYSDENISITANASENINPHSDYEIDIKIEIKNEVKNVKKYLQDSNLKITFLSAANSNDKLELLNIEYH